MTDLFIINDTHLGVNRMSGATKESAKALQQWQMTQFKQLLSLAKEHETLLINGDLFDKFEVSKQTEFGVFLLLKDFLDSSHAELILSAGNHDLSTNSEKRSSFENLCRYLFALYPDRVVCISANEHYTSDNYAVLAHCQNQTLFDEKIDYILSEYDIKYLFVHCNLMSPFAEHSDHSLNFSQEQLDACQAKGITVVFAHEHNGRRVQNAVVVGNQIPSSIADCLDPNPCKQYAILRDDDLQLIDFIKIDEVYAEADWTNDTLPATEFLRLTGNAEFEQAADVVQKIANTRSEHSAFVISNAVKIGELASLDVRTDELNSFDIQQSILKELPENLHERFKAVLAASNH